MLRRTIIKRISILFAVIFAFIILQIFPKKNDTVFISNNIYDNKSHIYLFNKNKDIVCLDIYYKGKTTSDLIQEVTKYLTDGTNESNTINESFSSVLPNNTKLLNYSINNTELTVNYSNEFYESPNMLYTIEALVYSYTEIKGINSLVIKVDNKYIENINTPLNRSLKINKSNNISSLKNINEITIYYLINEGNLNYYLPVTKYINSNKEKIEIIIEELSSSSTYNSNLVDYIKDTKLVSYEVNDTILSLNFNKYLFDTNDNKLTEKIIYSINSSINNTYNDIDTVIYYFNNNLYNTYFLDLG